MSSGTTLYYPYIHPRSLGNIKSALLYWDRVRRIVPSSVRLEGAARGDGRDLQILADRGLLVATDPQVYSAKAADRFFAEMNIDPERFRLDRGTARTIVDNSRGIHAEKIADPVIRRLHEEGLSHRFGDWLGMREEVAAYYMYCLASEMAENIEAPLLAETQDDAAIGQALLFAPHSTGDVSHTLAQLDIDFPLEDQLQNVSATKLASFVESRAGERRRFRSAIESAIQKLRSTSDPNALADYLADNRAEIAEATSDSKSALSELGVATVGGLAKITVPAGTAAALAALPLPPVSKAILAGTGIAVSLVSLWAETRGKLRAARRDSPYHYIGVVHRELGVARRRKAVKKRRRS